MSGRGGAPGEHGAGCGCPGPEQDGRAPALGASAPRLQGLATTQELLGLKSRPCQVSHQLPPLEDKSKGSFLHLFQVCSVGESWLGLSMGLLAQWLQNMEVIASVCSDFNCFVPGDGVG